MSGLTPLGAPAEVRLSKTDVFIGRAAEQIALAGSSLLLAARLGPTEFAPVGVLLVVNTLAITLADQGLGWRVLRLSPGAQVDRRSLVMVRRTNAMIALAALLVATQLTGEARALLAIGAGLWFAGGEASPRKASALRAGESRRVATSEGLGAGMVAACSLVGSIDHSHAIGWVALGLLGKHLLEIGLARPWHWAFGAGPSDSDRYGVWLAQALAYAIANIDYVFVAMLLGEEALAVYLLGYRISSAIPSQVAFVVSRLATVDFASGDPALRQARYERYTRTLFLAGGAGAIATISLAPLLEVVLGDDWRGVSWTLAILALAAPWRSVLGIAGTLAVVNQSADRLVRWEIIRLVGTTCLLASAAANGFGWLLSAVVVSSGVAVLIYHRVSGNVAGIWPWRPLPALALASGLLLGAITIAGWSRLGVLT